MIDIKKDINFRYIFGKDSEPNKIALKGLIEAFVDVKVTNLEILTSELSRNIEEAKKSSLDIQARFGTGEKIDVEMQMCNNRHELAQRMAYYGGQLVSSQIKKGEPYTKIKRSYVLFILDFKWIEDEKLVHTYIKKEKEDYTDIPQGDWNPFVVVELPKAKYKEEMNISEEYTFVLKYCTEEKYHDKIELIKQREKGIFYMMKCANNISQNEMEWLKKLEEERNEMDRAQKVENARLEGIEIGLEKGEKIGSLNTMKENIKTMYKNKCDIQFIAKVLEQSIEYVQNVLNEK